MSETVNVAVRLRPFNAREKERNSKCCVRMEGKTCTLVHPSGNESMNRRFTFDHVFNSFNEGESSCATQRTVWESIGKPVLEAAWEGYNVSLFAYGQTGSGKSHSMVGFDSTDKGIIPKACERMFERISKNEESDLSFRVECSMLEIYNERVRDLFVSFSANAERKGGLRVRDAPTTGAFVEGLKSAPVSSYAQIEKLMQQGTKNRTIAATNMNETSSRAHTIFMVKLTQTRVAPALEGNALEGSSVPPPRTSERTSVINLVDLAGSERQKGTGSEGDRLKEAGAINKSLAALGNVISALAANAKSYEQHDQQQLASTAGSSGGSSGTGGANRREHHVPYRDSVLTHLLKNSLGGNARTTMLAAVSPADINFDETLSTLKYADRAKQIRNKPIVNEDMNAKVVRELKEQVEMLRRQLLEAQSQNLRQAAEAAAAAAAAAATAEQQQTLSQQSTTATVALSKAEAVSAAVEAASAEDVTALLEAERSEMRAKMEKEMEQRLREMESMMHTALRASPIGSGALEGQPMGVLEDGSIGLHNPEMDAERDWAARQAETDAMMLAAQEGVENGTSGAALLETEPHLSNLNEDPALSGVLTYLLREGDNRVGSSSQSDNKSADHRNDADPLGHAVVLGGLGILPSHALVVRRGNVLELTGKAGARTCVNGRPISGAASRPSRDTGDAAGKHKKKKKKKRHKEAKAAAARPELEVSPESMTGQEASVEDDDDDDENDDGDENGGTMTVRLHHNDRVVIGTNCVLRVVIPGARDANSIADDDSLVDWQFAMAELNRDIISAMNSGKTQREAAFAAEREAMAKKVKELEGELQAQRKAHLESKEGSGREDTGRAAELEAKLAAQVEETKRLKARQEDEMAMRTVLDDALLRMLPLVHEANTISTEMGKGMRFAVKLVTRTVELMDQSEGSDSGSDRKLTSYGGLLGEKFETEIAILVHHEKDADRDPVMWSQSKFCNRIYLMREMHQIWRENGGRPGDRDSALGWNLVTGAYDIDIFAGSQFATQEGDPFFDPPEDHMVGVSRIQLEPLLYLLDVDEWTPLVDYRGQSQGELSVKIVPTSADGSVDLEELEDLHGMHGKPLELQVSLAAARGLSRKAVQQSRSLYVTFRFFSGPGGDPIRTPRVALQSINPKIDVAHTLRQTVTPAFIDFTSSAALSFELWASVDEPGGWDTPSSAPGTTANAANSSNASSHSRRTSWGDTGDGTVGKDGGDDDNEIDNDLVGDDDEDDDEGIIPDGRLVARHRSTPPQQSSSSLDSGLVSGSRNRQSPVLTVLAADYEAMRDEVVSLRKENLDLKQQLEQAMVLIASSGDRGHRRGVNANGTSTVATANSKPLRKRALDAAQNLDRDINGTSTTPFQRPSEVESIS